MPTNIEVRVNKEVATVDDKFDFNSGDDFLTPTAEIVPGDGIKVWSYEKTIYIADALGAESQPLSV